MRRQFVKHGLVYGGANMISSIGTVLLVPVYTRALQPGEYGIVDYFIVVQTLIQICAGLEITQAIARFYADAEAPEERRAYASTGLWFLVASFAAMCALLYLGALMFGAHQVGLGGDTSLFAIALISVYVRMLFYALQSQARWELRSDLYSLASFVAMTCSVGLVAYLLLVERRGLLGVFGGLSVGYAVACAFCLVSLRGTYRWSFDGRKFRQMLRFSLPLTFSSLALFFASYGDRIILKSALGFHELGVYGIAARVAAVITLAINGFQLGAAPLIYRHHGQPGAPAELAQLMRLFLATGLLGVAALAAFSLEMLQILTTPAYASAWPLIPVLALAIVLANLYIFAPGLTIRHMTTRFAFINVGTACISLLTIAVFLRIFGVMGAAVGVLCGSAAGFVMHAAFSQRVYWMPIDWHRLVAGVAITAMSIGVCWMLGVPGAMSLSLRLILFIGASLAIIAVLSTRQERASAQRLIATGFSSSLSRAWIGPGQ